MQMVLIIVAILTVLGLVGIRLFCGIRRFRDSLNYINDEISRTKGSEQKAWKRRKRRLYKKFYKYFKY